VITDGPWTVANGMITPTLKIRRGSLEAQYQQKIDGWRDQGVPIVWESTPAVGGIRHAARAAAENPARPE